MSQPVDNVNISAFKRAVLLLRETSALWHRSNNKEDVKDDKQALIKDLMEYFPAAGFEDKNTLLTILKKLTKLIALHKPDRPEDAQRRQLSDHSSEPSQDELESLHGMVGSVINVGYSVFNPDQSDSDGDPYVGVITAYLGFAAPAKTDGPAQSSKYDFVKIRVWLGEHMEHYYVLSRFLISRMLEVTKIPQDKAIKIALDLKKYLVDNDKLDVSQPELETVLFSMMNTKGFGPEYVRRFKMVNLFQQQKRPLIILICGTKCTGKSTLAHQLASRLNLPNVLQTDALHEVLSLGKQQHASLWTRDLDSHGLIAEFQRECRVVRKAIDGDLEKCITDGKSMIIEGVFLDPGLYLADFSLRYSSSHGDLHLANNDKTSNSSIDAEPSTTSLRYSSTPKRWNNSNSGSPSCIENGIQKKSDIPVPDGSNNTKAAVKPPPVFIPVVLSASLEEHTMMAEDGFDGLELHHDGGDESINNERFKQSNAMERARDVQTYLCQFEAAGVPVLQVGIKQLPTTLDRLHDYVLKTLLNAIEEELGGFPATEENVS